MIDLWLKMVLLVATIIVFIIIMVTLAVCIRGDSELTLDKVGGIMIFEGFVTLCAILTLLIILGL